ncbi:MAG: tripartite tricarboxylate transporter substrate binding protein, partial [Alphaproteobacteria bacterium]|nr:tripartite tricarboxylate transporter substrate binding protein [Alphaproteobacteria bacterium]
MIKPIGLGAAALGAVTLALAGTAGAAFPEKNITFIIPYGPGGGFDTYVRKISPVMQKYLGGKINVVPKNVAGA